MKSSKKTQERKEKANINYNAVFAGETLVTPILFNPTADQVRKIKNISEDYDVNEPSYNKTFTINGEEKEFSVISLLCKFNPNEILDVKNEYKDDVFVSYEILCSKDEVKGSNSGKYQVIDESNISAWVRVPDRRKKLADVIRAEINSNTYSEYDSIHKLNPDTARIACVGEVALYQLIFNMSSLDPHKPNDDPKKNMELTEFKFGENPTETFKLICDGDVSVLNELMVITKSKSELLSNFSNNGVQNTLGVFLGAQPNSDKTKLYQTVMSCPTHINVNYSSTFRITDINSKKKTYEYLGETRLPKEAIKTLTDEKHPWKAEWGGTLSFKEVKLSDIKQLETTIDDDEDDEFPF